MDICWERTYPYYQINLDCLKALFSFLGNREIIATELIKIGCRNSNYILKTKKDNFLLRVTSQDHALVENELALNKLLTPIINIPKLLDYKIYDKRYFILYEYIKGCNFSYYLSKNKIKKEHLRQISSSLAKINYLRPMISLKKHDLPPFNTWYDLFLSNTKTKKIITFQRTNKIKKFLKDNQLLLEEITKFNGLIHSDFRPANMIVTENNQIYYVDWEYATYGHILADMGQFFRYKECFTNCDRDLFASVYNQEAEHKIPSNWYLLARLRDLINPLQLIGNVEKKLQQEKDLLKVIDDIIEDILHHSG